MNEEHKHEWKEVYNGIKCETCGLFYPDNGNYFAPLDDDEPTDPYGYVDGEPDYTLDDLEWSELFE
jgi:hypothetical protein